MLLILMLLRSTSMGKTAKICLLSSILVSADYSCLRVERYCLWSK